MKAACALVVAQFAGLHLYDLEWGEKREREREDTAMRKRAGKRRNSLGFTCTIWNRERREREREREDTAMRKRAVKETR